MNKLSTEQRALTVTHLARLGAYLDAADTGRIQVSPAQYKVAAMSAAKVLSDHEADPLAIEACSVSPALRELRSNIALARGISTGALELPEAVRAAMSVSRRPQERK